MQNKKFITIFSTDFGEGFGSYILQQEAEIIIANNANILDTKLTKVRWWKKFNKFVSYVYSVSHIADITDDHLLHYCDFRYERAELRNLKTATIKQQISFIKSIIKQAKENDSFKSQRLLQLENSRDKQQALLFADNNRSLDCCFLSRCCCLNKKL